MKTTEREISIKTPRCEPGIGRIIRAPDSANLIDGVRVRPNDLWPGGEQVGMLIYVTDRLYDPQDEGRIAHDHSSIAYDWKPQYK